MRIPYFERILLVVPVVSIQLSPDYVVELNSTVLLTCEATAGDVPIYITWSDPSGADITPDSSNASASTISITPPMNFDYGRYTCTASNEFGNDSDVINLIQAGKFWNCSVDSS